MVKFKDDEQAQSIAARIGLIVPSSNTTMETELPMLFGRLGDSAGEMTFHSSRMRMSHVTEDELRRMNAQTPRAAAEIADLSPSVVATACLVAIMAQGKGSHVAVEKSIREVLRGAGSDAPVVSSAGALLAALRQLRARRIAIVTPYMKPLTRLVANYIEADGIEVGDSLSLEVSDNAAVGALKPNNLREHWRNLDLTGVDTIVLSACVQMPSLSAIEFVERESGLPTISAATSTAWALLAALGIDQPISGAGMLLSERGRVQKTG